MSRFELPARKGQVVTIELDRRTDTRHSNAGQDTQTSVLEPARAKYGEGPYRRLWNTDGVSVTGSRGWSKGRRQRIQRDSKGHPIGPAPVNVSRVDLAVVHKGRARVLRIELERPNRDIAVFRVSYRWVK